MREVMHAGTVDVSAFMEKRDGLRQFGAVGRCKIHPPCVNVTIRGCGWPRL